MSEMTHVTKSFGEKCIVRDFSATILRGDKTVSYTHLRAHETVLDLVCRLLLEKKKKNSFGLRNGTDTRPLSVCVRLSLSKSTLVSWTVTP